MVGIYVKDRPIQAKFKEDLKSLFEKYSPFNMKVSYKNSTIPVLFRKEKVEAKDLLKFFNEFKKAYKENYPFFICSLFMLKSCMRALVSRAKIVKLTPLCIAIQATIKDMK